MLTPEAALERILRHCAPLSNEIVELGRAAGRVLAVPIVSDRRLPPWDNSAMDGYAVRAAEVRVGEPLPVHGVVAAGHPASSELLPGAALRIMTGAPLPAGADAVIMREEADERDGQVRFRIGVRTGHHVRRAGEDVERGDTVLSTGAVLHAGELGLLAALGRTLVEVHRRPQVAVVSTGDELCSADRAPGSGQIVNSNAHALAAQVEAAGGVARVLPIARDDRAALAAIFAAALGADVVLSSGGVSVGEFDYVKDVLKELGAVEQFARVAMKPGKPVTFALRQRGIPDAAPVLLFGLPGNPASSMVSFELFVRPALRRLLGHGAGALSHPVVPVQLDGPVSPDRSRLHFTRARVYRPEGKSGELWAQVPRQQGSGMLRSMVNINALLHIPPGAATLPAGAVVSATLLQPV